MNKDIKIIALDGRCAAGKTTLSEKLRQEKGAQVIHTDDFFLPPAMRTKKRLSEAGGNIHYERFRKEVVDKLIKGEAFTYRKFDCSVMDYNGEISIEPCGLIVVEGSYSHHPFFGSYADIKVFLDISPDEQMKRIIKRNGSQKAAAFRDKWIPMEEAYFEIYGIRDKADYITEMK